MDWCDGGPVGPLARLSYALHKSLASELGQDTGYREVRTFSVAASAKPGDSLILCARNCWVHLWLPRDSKLVTVAPLLYVLRQAASCHHTQLLLPAQKHISKA